MRSIFPSVRTQAPAFHHDALWFSATDAPVPAVLLESWDIVTEATLPLAAPIVCLALAEGESLASSVRACRGRLGEQAHLVMVFPGRELPASAVRAIDFGADDVLALEDASALALVLARGERITQGRRQAEAINNAHALERDYLQACIDNLPTPIFYKDDRGTYIGCNKAYLEYTGLTPDEFIGRTAYDIATEEDARSYEEVDAALLESGGSQFYEVQVRHSDGTLREVLCQSAAITDVTGARRGIAGAMLDISERKKLEAQLADLAARDPLTNIFNRRKFFTLANEILAENLVRGNSVALAVLDIDHFKSVNDRFGHATGDRVICDVAAFLERRIGEGNIVARAGGEEFFAILSGHSAASASGFMETLRAEIATLPIMDTKGMLEVTVSIGVAELARDEDVWACLRRADSALYAAKFAGRNRISLAA